MYRSVAGGVRYWRLKCMFQETVNCISLCKESHQRNKLFHNHVRFNGTVHTSRSSLYINHLDDGNVSVVDVDLDLKNRLEKLDILTANLKARGLSQNVHLLHSMHSQLLTIEKEKTKLENEKVAIAGEMKRLVKSKSSDEQQKADLVKRGREVREKLKNLQAEYFQLEEDVILDGLKLPSPLHPGTPESQVVKNEFGTEPNENESHRAKSHTEIGYRTSTILPSDVSPGAYYLQGQPAKLQHQLCLNLGQMLTQLGLTNMQCPDMVKTLIMEACGQPFDDPTKSLVVMPRLTDYSTLPSGFDVIKEGKWDNTLYLTGVSPMAFWAYLTRMTLLSSSMPVQFFSIGTCYTPMCHMTSDSFDLVSAPHPTVLEVAGVASDPAMMTSLYQDYVDIMQSLGEATSLKMRLVQVAATDLQVMESARTDLEVWLPSKEDYVKLGSVAMWQDFVSRRLMVKHVNDLSDQTSRNYVYSVHGTLLNITRLVAAIMEYWPDKENFCEFDWETFTTKLSKSS